MPVELIGLIATQDASETRRSDGPLVDRDYVKRFALAHEASDFDRVLIGYSSASPDNLQVAAYAAAHTLDELLAGLSALAGALPAQLGPPPLAARPRTGV